METNRKIFYITVDDSEGMNAISLVDSPAVQLPFLKFDELTQPVKLKFDDAKHIITGVVCLSDTPIYRYSEELGEYWVVFTKETIQKMVEKYSKNNLWNSVNLQHDDSRFVEGVYMIESYIKDNERGIVPKEFATIPDGSWLCSFKIENEELWKTICETGEFNGFSLQGYFSLDDAVKMAVEESRYEEEEISMEEFITDIIEGDKFESKPLKDMSLLERIKNAMDYHYLCALDYRDDEGVTTYREVAIYAYGLSRSGHKVIRCYHTFGDSKSNDTPYWRLFRLDRILKLTPQRKSNRQNIPHNLFNPRGDNGMSVVYKVADYSK